MFRLTIAVTLFFLLTLGDPFPHPEDLVPISNSHHQCRGHQGITDRIQRLIKDGIPFNQGCEDTTVVRFGCDDRAALAARPEDQRLHVTPCHPLIRADQARELDHPGILVDVQARRNPLGRVGQYHRSPSRTYAPPACVTTRYAAAAMVAHGLPPVVQPVDTVRSSPNPAVLHPGWYRVAPARPHSRAGAHSDFVVQSSSPSCVPQLTQNRAGQRHTVESQKPPVCSPSSQHAAGHDTRSWSLP